MKSILYTVFLSLSTVLSDVLFDVKYLVNTQTTGDIFFSNPEELASSVLC